MLLNFSTLLIVTMAAGLTVYLIPKWKGEQFNLALIFSGSYLFGITVIHILPELFNNSFSTELVGSMILVGFFLQLIIEYFTSGVEHGHVHLHENGHSHSVSTSVSLLIALCFHAFLEGSLLAHPTTIHEHHASNALLIGISMHKIPAAFALMSLVTCQFGSKIKQITFLSIFALASPIGMLISDYLSHENVISESGFIMLFALVGGSFLKISTTIFFESSPEHKFNLKKIIISVLAAVLAILAESLF
ncbi:MAG: zinc permease [Cyclobacteriaceae bacterium]